MTSPTHTDAAPPPLGVSERGLSEAEAQRRLPERPPPARTGASRSYGSIVRANVFTVFNLILATFGTVTLLYGDWRDALFLGILVANTGVGITQEVRAKRALDRLSALVAPTATVVRDGRPRPLHVDEVVLGDLVRLAPGDQLVADGRLVSAEGLALDESILSGESAAVRSGAGAEVRSGSLPSRDVAPTSLRRSAPTATPSGSPAKRARFAIRARPSSWPSTACCSGSSA
jgi:magnesium-transporting ATPase (P-type)